MTDNLPGGCRRLHFSVKGDERGQLVAIEGGLDVPFDIQRAYYVFGTQPGVARGFHAHRRLSQVAVCVAGHCRMTLDDGRTKAEIVLNRPDDALLIEPMVWHEMHDFSPDCVMLVLADNHYDEHEYIRDASEFAALVKA